MREFFGFGGYTRPAEGFLSWQHLAFVSFLVVIMFTLAILMGLKSRSLEEQKKNRVLIVSALLIDGMELFKIVLFCVRQQDPMNWVYNLPLFLCSVQLIALPLAAFSHGKLRETSLDFVLIFGLLGALCGTYGAGNNYSAYPVLSFDNVVSGLTHTIAGFASLYVGITGLARLKKQNIPATFAILLGFCAAAFVANIFTNANYMFLLRGDGTPYDIFYNLVGGSPILYPLVVIALFLVYIIAFYQVYYLVQRRHTAHNT